MSKIIDLGITVPTVDDILARLRDFTSNREGKGVANYHRIFGPRWADSLGMSMEEMLSERDRLSEDEFATFLRSKAQSLAADSSSFLKELDEIGIEWGLVTSIDYDKTAELLSHLSGRIKAMALANPLEGKTAVRELERSVRELGFIAFYASPFHWGIQADDPKFHPFYAKALELDIPVFIYTSMNYRTDYPMDIGRPLYVDRVAMAFPEMRIVCDCGGWPWVPEMIGVARRHPNVYITTSSHRPKYLAVPGSGWEMLLQFGNTLLQDNILFASGVGDLGIPLGQIVKEMRELPLKEKVKEKWLYHNAVRLFDRG